MFANNLNDSFEEDIFSIQDSSQDIFEIENVNNVNVASDDPPVETARRGVKRNLNFGATDPSAAGESSVRKNIETYVFLDFETTGLFKLDLDRNRPDAIDDPDVCIEYFKNFVERENVVHPRVVEIGMVAVRRSDFEKTVTKIKKKEDFKSITRSVFSCPVNHGLTGHELDMHLLQIDPAPEVLTFSDRRCFREEWPGVKHFLDGLKKPICFVAHNGLKFDFRILLAEMKRANIDVRENLGGCFFADSIYAFKSVDQVYLKHIKNIVDAIDFTKIKVARDENIIVDAQPVLIPNKDEIQRTPDRLPPQLIPRTAPARICPRGDEDQLESDHPFRYLKINNWPLAIKARFQSSFIRKDTDDWSFNECSYKRFNKSFGQGNLYQAIFHETFCAHTAVNDCEALLRLCLAFETVPYFDKASALLFNL
ncbi:unnamed protein product [Auanema sp. JU1783]|nr:unnamed protein product [Auanema sp. JU1783]